MKFFEGLKKNIKEVVVGSAVVAGSVLPLESSAQEANNENVDIKKTEITAIDPSKQENIKTDRIKIEVEKISKIREELGLLENKNDPQYFRNLYIKYMEHPSYKLRLAKEMYGDQIIDEEKQQKIDEEYEERMFQLKMVPIFIDESRGPSSKEHSMYDRENNQIKSRKKDLFHELSHSVEWRRSSIDPTENEKGFNEKKIELISNDSENFGRILSEIDSLYLEKYKILGDSKIEYRKNYNEFIKLINEYIINNENSNDFKEKHSDVDALKKEINSEYNDISLNRFFEIFNSPFEQLFFLKNYGELMQKLTDFQEKEKTYNERINKLEAYFNYLNSNTEIKARLNYLRIKAMEEYDFNLDREFNIHDFEELKKDPQYEDLKIDMGLSDEQINELMKYTAENVNEDDKNKTYYHPGWGYNNNQA